MRDVFSWRLPRLYIELSIAFNDNNDKLELLILKLVIRIDNIAIPGLAYFITFPHVYKCLYYECKFGGGWLCWWFLRHTPLFTEHPTLGWNQAVTKHSDLLLLLARSIVAALSLAPPSTRLRLNFYWLPDSATISKFSFVDSKHKYRNKEYALFLLLT